MSIKLEDASIKQLFKSIKKQSEFTFVYNVDDIERLDKVSLNVSESTVEEILDHCFKGTGMTYKVRDKVIIIVPREEEKFIPEEPLEISQERVITGIVTDESGNPLPGVSIQAKGTGKGTITDSEGKFTIAIGDEVKILAFSFVGMLSKEVEIGEMNELNIQLFPDLTGLEEVIVIGYGSMSKVNLTGSVAQITGNEISNQIAPTTSEMLQGLSPNLNITLDDGDINGNANINVRGVGSINGAQPLILIDGVQGDIERLNPRDIASISVLKDAASSSIYGARAAFGVILVTTKQAKEGKTTISYNTNYGWSSPTIRTDHFITDGLEWATLSDKLSLLENTSTYLGYSEDDYTYLEARKNDPTLPSVLIKTIDGKERYVHYGNTDWWHTIFQDVQPHQEHNLSISGNTDKVAAFLSGRLYQRQGIYKINPDNLHKYSLRSNVTITPVNWLTIQNNSSIFNKLYTHPATNTRNVGGASNSEDWRKYTYHASPLYLPTNPDGSLIIKGAYTNNRDIADGTFADLIYGKSRGEETDYELLNTTKLEAQIVEGLSFKSDYSFRKRNQAEWVRIISAPYTNQPNGEGVAYYKENTQIYKELTRKELYQAVNAYLEYNTTVADRHNFTFLTGLNREWNSFKRNIASRDGNLSTNLNSFNLSTGDNFYLSSNEEDWAIQALFYRIMYNYNNRYLLEFNGRFDASSRFPAENRSGFFPSASAAWRVSEESFWDPLAKVVNSLKFRTSYGQLGNQNVGAYDYISTMDINQGNYIVNGEKVNYFSTPQPVSSNYTWEYTQTVNLGFDASFLRSRIYLVFDWFQRDTKDMLTQGKKLPSVFGAEEPNENAADLRTRGFELAVTWRDNKELAGREFHYSISGSVGDSKTEITKFDNPNGDINQFYVGQELGEIWGYTVEGFFLTDDEYLNHADQLLVNERIRNNYLINHPVAGDIKFKDIDEDGKITPGDQTLDNPGDLKIIGNSLPRYSYNLRLGIQYAGFNINAFFQGIGKLDWFPETDNGYFWGPFARQYMNFYPESMESLAWSPDNPDAYFPRLAVYAERGGPYEGAQLGVYSDKYLQNAAYLRLKSLNLGYTLPDRLLSKTDLMGSIRIFATGTNLLTFSPLYKNNPDRTVDPEQLGNGNAYPFSKTISLGFEIIF
jgi:TonB-linked SusC/RagA family outer membrane protein